MGCDIHVFAEKKDTAGNYEGLPVLPPLFDWRSYGLFGFLAGVRNYSGTSPISEPRGFPQNASFDIRTLFESEGYVHTPSWLTLDELEAFNYDAETEDRRVTRNGDGGCTCDPGEGKKMPFREFLGEGYFKELARLREAGADRIVFWFDN